MSGTASRCGAASGAVCCWREVLPVHRIIAVSLWGVSGVLIRHAVMPFMRMNHHYLLFRCRECNWWAVGTRSSEEPIAEDKLPDAYFDVKCTAEDCCWTARLQGSEAYEPPRRAAAASSGTN